MDLSACDSKTRDPAKKTSADSWSYQGTNVNFQANWDKNIIGAAEFDWFVTQTFWNENIGPGAWLRSNDVSSTVTVFDPVQVPVLTPL